MRDVLYRKKNLQDVSSFNCLKTCSRWVSGFSNAWLPYASMCIMQGTDKTLKRFLKGGSEFQWVFFFPHQLILNLMVGTSKTQGDAHLFNMKSCVTRVPLIYHLRWKTSIWSPYLGLEVGRSLSPWFTTGWKKTWISGGCLGLMHHQQYQHLQHHRLESWEHDII